MQHGETSSLLDAYLDIETTGLSCYYDNITVLGIFRTDGLNSELIQLIGKEITPDSLMQALQDVQTIYTYNGSGFDLPFIRALLEIDLARSFRHRDLMLDCWRKGLYGGLKAVEVRLGIQRQLKDVDGREAVRLWRRFQEEGDQDALQTLLYYNSEDVLNLKTLRQVLESYH